MRCWRLLGLIMAIGGCSSSPDAPSAHGTGGSAGSFSSGGTANGGAATGTGGDTSGGTGGAAGEHAGGAAGAHAGGAAGAHAGGTAGATFQPYFFDDFEGYEDGASLSGNHPFDASGRSKATSDEAFRGSQSARMEIQAGDGGGFGKWGGIVPIQPALTKGQEVWVRLQVRWPSEFQFTASPWMKFLRLHSTRAGGGNAGYNDLYIDQADSTQSVLRTIKEAHDVWAVYDGPQIPRDQWESYEMYLFIDDQSVESGGQGRVRIWRDDALIFDRTDVPTIVEAAGTIDYFYLFTYWNNEKPPNNHCYIDDLVIATSASPPPNRDTSGRVFIGPWTP
ncbi:MAG: hypothetical protein KC766_18775 [Myxococcales bacterium]|nr:hypothetical protein [Myxococcales bacterium]